ncbi:GNAT family N-acetyltransferase [Citrobacter freundii]|uniref:GNAT family N-acetyltransferase n=1 Tax=Citrobacter freundii TaxID=546 RepID=UPI0028BDB13B|nr:GNAT family N-acetyltransferase [Citrobacter freundii]MDT7344431.1 GNAT family N-acetyltransferase [Citrobacter freundii]
MQSLEGIVDSLKALDCVVTTEQKSLSTTIFSKHTFLEYQKKAQNKHYIVFSLCDVKEKKILSQIVFSKKNISEGEDIEFFSPITGAFSDFYLINERVALKKIDYFLSYIESYLAKNYNFKKLTYKFPPELYNEDNNNYLLNAMFNRGWKVNSIDLNYHLNIINEDYFRRKLSSSKRRELNRITREETSFTRVIEHNEIRSAYEVIKANRESQGYPMTMSWDGLYSLYLAMPDDVYFFSLKKDNLILASSVCLKINDEHLYVFYWGENPEFRKLSPIVKLAEQLYLLCIDEGFKTLDIGISTENSSVNQGLIDFKTNIGCELTKKISIEKALEKYSES